jgi:hypothetical protein
MTRLMTAALVVMLWAGVSGSVGQREWSFPNTKKNGRATVEYRHEGFHFVANYDYSQRNHATRWLLIDLAAASKRRFVLHKDDIRLLTPDGRELPVAPHQAFIDDSPGVQFVVQNAQAWRRPIDSYFSQRGRLEALNFQVFPGRGITSDEAIVDNDRVALGGCSSGHPQPDGRPAPITWPSTTSSARQRCDHAGIEAIGQVRLPAPNRRTRITAAPSLPSRFE